MQEQLKKRAAELLQNGTVDRVIGWERGDFFYDITPAVFKTPEAIERRFIYDGFCGANLSKYLVAETRKGGRVLAFLKPCDTYSFNQLLKEHRIVREKVYVIGISCDGMYDVEKIRSTGAGGLMGWAEEGADMVIETLYGKRRFPKAQILLERCENCKSKKLAVWDEKIGEDGDVCGSGRFLPVEQIERMTAEERFAFWQGELSRCIRCNACRNVCPACTCEKCVFDNRDSGIEQKAAATSFEENMFHIIRAFHVAGRCTDCGECARVCPQSIPLHLLNRKLIKDINELYGVYQAGADLEEGAPLTSYDINDCEPSVIYRR